MYYPHKVGITHIMFFAVRPDEVSLRHATYARTFNVPLDSSLGVRCFGPMQIVSEPMLRTLFADPDSDEPFTAQVSVNMPEGFQSLDNNAVTHSQWHRPETYEKKGLADETLSDAKTKCIVHQVVAVGQFERATPTHNAKHNWLTRYGKQKEEIAPGPDDKPVKGWSNISSNIVTQELARFTAAGVASPNDHHCWHPERNRHEGSILPKRVSRSKAHRIANDGVLPTMC